MGLVERVVPTAELEAAVREELNLVLQGGPDAQREFKILLDQIRADSLRQTPRTAEAIVRARTSAPAQAGLGAFFAKIAAPWSMALSDTWSWEGSAP